MKIVKLEAENIKKLRAVEITPAGDLVVVAGKNDAGKSSVLDAIAMALGGAALIPGEPVRKGTKAGKVMVDLGDMVVTRTFMATGGGSLKVENKDGAVFKSPQALLDKLLGSLTFDPLAFERLDGKTQADTLRRLVGLDVRDLDSRRQDLYDQRTEQNRIVKALQIEADGHPLIPDLPAAEVSVAALLDDLAAAEDLQRKATTAATDTKTAQTAELSARDSLANAHRELEKIRAAFVRAEQEIDFWEKAVTRAVDQVAERQKSEAAFVAAVPDTADLRGKVHAAEQMNAQVRANNTALAARVKLATARSGATALTEQIDALDAERKARIAAAAFPVPGLGMSDDGVILFDGLPFDQASTSARLRVSVAIGLALNSKLKVLLVRDGSLLDSGNLKLIAEMAAAADAQVWLEMMQETSAGAAVFIEDGSVKE